VFLRKKKGEGAAAAVNRRGKRQMEELTDVVRSMEMKQRQNRQRRRARWRNGRMAFSSSSDAEIRSASTAHAACDRVAAWP
jgi:CHASE3 domain sensor protein